MNGSETSIPSTEPSSPTSSASRSEVSPKPQPRSRTRAPARGGFASIASSPWVPSAAPVRSRYLTKRSKSGPLQASVASALSGATGDIASSYAEATVPQGLFAVLVWPPASNPPIPELEQPRHLFIAGVGAVHFPMPGSRDQGHRSVRLLVELVENDGLLGSSRLLRRPDASGLHPLPQPAPCVQLHVRVENLGKGIEVLLVESTDELADWIGQGAPSGAVALLVLLARSAPAGVVAAEFVVVVFDHGLDRFEAAAVRSGGLGGSDVDGTGAAPRSDLLQRRGLVLEGPAGVGEGRRLTAAVGRRHGTRLAGLDFDLGAEDQFRELVPDRVHQLLEHLEALVFVGDEGIDLGEAAEVDPFAHVVHVEEVFAPAVVDHLQQDRALEEAHQLLAELLFSLLIGIHRIV